MNTTDIPNIAPAFRFQWEEAQNCYVILYPEGMIKLSQSAGEIMKRCDGTSSVADIVAQIKQELIDSNIDNLEQDIMNFMGAAHDNGWIKTN